jgi:hypothetical protein
MSKTIKENVIRMRSRYGRKGKLALVMATGAMAVIPVPGLIFVPVCIAEWVRRAQVKQRLGL